MSMEKPLWRRLESSYVVDSPFLRLRRDRVQLPNGTIIEDYYVREAEGFVIVFPVTKEQTVVLVRQYRYAVDSVGLELPAGMLEPGEDPLACARRELAEETGYEAERWRLIHSYASEPVRSTARAYIFVAEGAGRTRDQDLDITEHIEVTEMPLLGVRSALRDGTIDAGASLAACYIALDALGMLAPS
jgi:ADP-ribose pyrophosphatase